ncbi:MAG: glutathione S-transferase family protein [Pseudomonadota bacterium]
MTGLTLYGNNISPFVRKVRVVLLETGQAEDVEVVEMMGNAVDPSASLSNPNPLGKIPALARPDGPTLHDSRVICRFLNARAHAALYPEARIWDVLTLEALADGILEAGVAMVYEERFREAAQVSAPWLEGQWAKIVRALDALEARWMSQLSGPVDMGQIAVGCALGYLDLRHAGRDWRSGRGPLVAWEKRFADRPAMAATQPVA